MTTYDNRHISLSAIHLSTGSCLTTPQNHHHDNTWVINVILLTHWLLVTWLYISQVSIGSGNGVAIPQCHHHASIKTNKIHWFQEHWDKKLTFGICTLHGHGLWSSLSRNQQQETYMGGCYQVVQSFPMMGHTYICTYLHMGTYAHTYIYIYTYPYIHTNMHLDIHWYRKLVLKFIKTNLIWSAGIWIEV